MIFFRSGKSKPFVASSKIKHSGLAAKARAIATRFCSPPDNSEGSLA